MPRHSKYAILALAVMLLGGLSGCVSDAGDDVCSATTACGHSIDVCCSVDGDCYYDYGGHHYTSASAVTDAACSANSDPAVAQSLVETAKQLSAKGICTHRP